MYNFTSEIKTQMWQKKKKKKRILKSLFEFCFKNWKDVYLILIPGIIGDR